MTWWEFLLRPSVLALMVPIVAIVTGGAIVITKMVIRHRERMALIGAGMHPDHPPDKEDAEADAADDLGYRAQKPAAGRNV